MSTVLADTHVLHWCASEPDRLSQSALDALESADELAVAAITWHELAWLATHGRISVDAPVRTWLELLARSVRTIPLTPAIAATAAALPTTFPRDPADRLIFASAVETGLPLVTKDTAIRRHRGTPTAEVIW